MLRKVQISKSMDSIAAFLDNSQAPEELFFGQPGNKVFDDCNNFSSRQKMNSQENDAAIRSNGIAQDISKISIAGNKYQRFSFYKLVNFLVSGAGLNIADIANIMTGFFKDISNGARAICIYKEFHGLFTRLANKLLLISKKCSVEYTGLNIFIGNGAVFFLDLFKIHPCCQRLENNMDRNTRPFDARFTMLNFRIYSNMLIKIGFVKHFIASFEPKLYHSAGKVSSAAQLPNSLDKEEVKNRRLCNV